MDCALNGGRDLSLRLPTDAGQADFSSGGTTYASDVGVPRDYTRVEMADQLRFVKAKRRPRNAFDYVT